MSFSDPEVEDKKVDFERSQGDHFSSTAKRSVFMFFLLIGVSFERLPLLNSLFFSSFFAFSGQKERERRRARSAWPEGPDELLSPFLS